MNKPTDAELVKWAAERVLGWTKHATRGNWGVGFWKARDGAQFRLSWNPLESDADAFHLVDAITAKGAFWFRLKSPWEPDARCESLKFWNAGFTACGCTGWNGEMDHRAFDPDRRRAIVLACLRLESGCLACCRTGEILPAGPSDAPVEICEACGGSGIDPQEDPQR